jgi:CheY-like chemotaxis protein
VDSEPGRGSNFYFSAKFGVQSEQRNLILHAEDIQGVRILVVDDNASAREILAGILKSLKFDADVVSGPIEAIRLLEGSQTDGRPYDLVLMDWMMPGVDGVEGIRMIRASNTISKTPAFVMVTAYSRDELLLRAESVKIDGVLVKPVSPSTLLDGILNALGKEVVSQSRKKERNTTHLEALKRIRGAHLLLVEDNPVNREVALEILHDAGLKVDIAHDGAEAVAKVPVGNYDGVLMDCQMPVLDGYEATRQIRLMPGFASLPILAMTANAMAGDREKVMAAGMNDHIAKPIDVNQLFLTLDRWVRPANPESLQASPKPKTLGEDFPDIPGLDLPNALSRMGGSRKLLRKILQRFCETQSGVFDRIRKALGSSDLVTATREAHTLKGLSGNIGAISLAGHAAELEAHFSGGESIDLSSVLVAAESELLDVIDRISAKFAIDSASNDVKDPLPVPDSDRMRSMIGKLRTQLADSDGEAADTLDALMEHVRNTVIESQVRPIAAAVADYEFELALKHLDVLLTRI